MGGAAGVCSCAGKTGKIRAGIWGGGGGPVNILCNSQCALFRRRRHAAAVSAEKQMDDFAPQRIITCR